jgi:hypothetical protein
MSAKIQILVIEFLIHGSLLLGLLWIMIKLQKLDYHFLGLLGSAALASALDMIPHFGHILAVPVLYFCIWKVTQSCIFPDAAFTVVIPYALMFCINLFMTGTLMGELRPSDKGAVRDEIAAQEPGAGTQPAAAYDSVTVTNITEVKAIAQKFSIKGVTRNADNSSLMLQSGQKTYMIFLGQAVSVQTDDGPVSVQFVGLAEGLVILNIRGVQVQYPVHEQ